MSIIRVSYRILSLGGAEQDGSRLIVSTYKRVRLLGESGGMPPPSPRLLLSLGADPNSVGQYGRTPLYRAAFAGHLDAVQVTLYPLASFPCFQFCSLSLYKN